MKKTSDEKLKQLVLDFKKAMNKYVEPHNEVVSTYNELSKYRDGITLSLLEQSIKDKIINEEQKNGLINSSHYYIDVKFL